MTRPPESARAHVANALQIIVAAHWNRLSANDVNAIEDRLNAALAALDAEASEREDARQSWITDAENDVFVERVNAMVARGQYHEIRAALGLPWDAPFGDVRYFAKYAASLVPVPAFDASATLAAFTADAVAALKASVPDGGPLTDSLMPHPTTED